VRLSSRAINTRGAPSPCSVITMRSLRGSAPDQCGKKVLSVASDDTMRGRSERETSSTTTRCWYAIGITHQSPTTTGTAQPFPASGVGLADSRYTRRGESVSRSATRQKAHRQVLTTTVRPSARVRSSNGSRWALSARGGSSIVFNSVRSEARQTWITSATRSSSIALLVVTMRSAFEAAVMP
jgi:hypothetical protein